MKNHRLRVIGGKWRGRQFHFSPTQGLRPTADRIRETVFNWLAPYIDGANCLDAFAGSGALGIEALSRGADRVLFLEKHGKVCRHLQQTLNQLEIPATAKVKQVNTIRWLQQNARHPFDIIFLDPPFNRDLLLPTLKHLQQGQWLKAGGLIYIECEMSLELLKNLPSGWEIHKIKHTKELSYGLIKN